MSDLKDKLIKLGSESPGLREHIRPVLDKVQERKEAGLTRDIQKIVEGSKIFTVKKKVADKIEDVLSSEGLYPKTAITSFTNSQASIIIVCGSGAKFIDNPTDRDIEYVAKKAADNIEVRGYRMESDGRINPDGRIYITLYQKI